jgi:hypothetical protein
MNTDARGFPLGDLRVSDADRDRALAELSEAFQAGRITSDELGQRSGQALAARAGKELTALLADLPVPRASAAAPHRAGRLPTARFTIAASVAATCCAFVALANALNPGPTLQQREAIRDFLAQRNLPVTLPPAQGFNWAGTITPAVIAVLLVGLIIGLHVARGRRA